MKKVLKVLATLLLLGGLGYGGWWVYERYFAAVPQEGTVYVQSVAAITGVGPAGTRSRYSGVVEAKNVIEVNPDKDLAVKECFVSAGDKVKAGTPLFSYDVESIEISFQQLQLDIQGLENGIQTGREKVESKKKQLARAREYKKYEIQMDIQTQELEIRKKEYELTGKRRQAEDMEKALQNTQVLSPVAGTIRSVKSTGGQDAGYGEGGESSAYITIVAGNDYCVKGTVSEQTIHTLQEGMEVRILSRIDDTVWSGRIYRINTEETKKTTERYYYYDEGSGEKASRYDFFVELDTNEGLLMGQHVYIEPGAGGDGADDGMLLPLYYLVEEGAEPFVYAADENGRIEKRTVAVGTRDEENGTVVILSGLSYLDRIAFPDESVQVGMTASETSYVPEDMDLMEPGQGFDGADMPMVGFDGAEDGLLDEAFPLDEPEGALSDVASMDGAYADDGEAWEEMALQDLPEIDFEAPAEGAAG